MARKKKTIAVADAETDPFEYKVEVEPFVFGYYDGDTYEQFWGNDCVDRFVEYIKNKHVFLYFHNGGKFDFYFLLHYLDPEFLMIKQRIAECRIGEATLRDSYLILPLPLSAHGKDDFEYWKMKREYRDKYRKEIETYLYHDCINLYDWVIKFVERFGTSLTLPGAAMKQLRKTGYEVANTTEGHDSKFRAFYFGGRTQAFKHGRFDGPITYVDINSAYPFAMLRKHPRGIGYMVMDRLPKVRAPYFAIIDAVSKGALPIRDDDGSIAFPVDDSDTPRTYHATGWEIQAGLDTGTLRVTKVHTVYLFVDTNDFSEYVNKFYTEKLEAKKANDKDTEIFSKFMLNSCYGKFGQNPRNFDATCITELGAIPDEAIENPDKLFGCGFDWITDDDGVLHHPESIETEGRPDFDLMKDRGWYKVNELGTDHSVWEKADPGDRFFNVATAASITGFVRAYLWRAINQCKNVLYCDTDSIMAQEFNGTIGDELGDWSIEAQLKHVWIGGKKLYTALTEDEEWKVASKGARLTPLQIQRIVENNETITWRNIAPSFSLTMGTRWVERRIKRRG